MPGASERQVAVNDAWVFVNGDEDPLVIKGDKLSLVIKGDKLSLVINGDKVPLVINGDELLIVIKGDEDPLVIKGNKFFLVIKGNEFLLVINGDEDPRVIKGDEELVDSSHAAAAAAEMPETTIRLRIGFPNGIPPKSTKKKVMANVGPWFTKKGYEVECDNANTFYITCQPNDVELLMQPSFPHRMKGVTVDFHEVGPPRARSK